MSAKVFNSPHMLTVFERIAQERSRQRMLLLNGTHLFSPDSPVADANRKLRVLVEEVGEVAEVIDRLEFPHTSRREQILRDHLQDELVQVAAVAVAWLESLEAK